MTNRKTRARIAQETLDILDSGGYEHNGSQIDIRQSLQDSIDNTRLYGPEDLESLRNACSRLQEKTASHADSNLPPDSNPSFAGTSPASVDSTGKRPQFTVENCTTLAAARAIRDSGPDEDVVCLNFASAKNPGGGFKSGSQAQEESLARASGLYPCINREQKYYEVNRTCGTALYTHHAIYSPCVPVIRDDRDALLAEPYLASFITSPAVNAGAFGKKKSEKQEQIAEVMRVRIEMVLSIAVVHGHRTLVLGAWGCGVFRNEPENIAGWFYEWLCERDTFAGLLDQVVFAVLDSTPQQSTIRPFRERFA